MQTERVGRSRKLEIDQMKRSGITKPTVPGNCSATYCSRSRIRFAIASRASSRCSSRPRSGRCGISGRGQIDELPSGSACGSGATTVDRGSPQRLEISRLPSRASWPSSSAICRRRATTTWITSPSPARSLASIPLLLSRSSVFPCVCLSIHSAMRNKIPTCRSSYLRQSAATTASPGAPAL